MSKQDDGGPACGRCGSEALRRQGHQWLCAMHYRFGQMRQRARRDGKAIPTWTECENLSTHLRDMACPNCKRRMNWLARDGQATVVTFQHYRSGSFGLVCRSCNTRHAALPGDEFEGLPTTHKRCPRCMAIKHFDEFSTDRGRYMGKKTYCRACEAVRHREWVDASGETYRAARRAYYHKRAADGRPIPRLRARAVDGGGR